MLPALIPYSLCKTLTTGANELVVHDAAETITSSEVKISSFTPNTTVLVSASLAGAEIRTRLAPALICACDFSAEV